MNTIQNISEFYMVKIFWGKFLLPPNPRWLSQVIAHCFVEWNILNFCRNGSTWQSKAADLRTLSPSRAIFSCDQAALRTPLSVCPSVCPSVCLSHLFNYVPVTISSWNFQELLPLRKVMFMQEVKVRGQKSRSQMLKPNLAVSRL